MRLGGFEAWIKNLIKFRLNFDQNTFWEGSGGSQGGSQVTKIGYRRSQDNFKRGPRAPKTSPRRPKGSPKWHKEGPRGAKKLTWRSFWSGNRTRNSKNPSKIDPRRVKDEKCEFFCGTIPNLVFWRFPHDLVTPKKWAYMKF